MVGRQLSRYQIVEEVGSGGMSVVYRGLDTSLQREVAVKVLHPHLAGKEESRKRFSREAQAVAKLHHPNILEIYDFSAADGDGTEAFIVTEFIRGQTLRQLAESHPLRPPEVAAMALHELACALEHAHAIGVIHRDIKPENVMIRDDGCVKLMDFGIAKILDRDEKMTLTGALVGSPAHMAPEIIEGDEAGPEADIFSLGTILYWLCTGKLPFFAANTTATLKRILDAQFDDPRTLNPAVSDGLYEVIARCLAREPSARYPSASALREALAALLADASVDRPSDDFALFFADPQGATDKLTQRIIDRRLAQAREAQAAGQAPKAMAALGQVLALRPEHGEALSLLGSFQRKARQRRRLGWAALAVLLVLLAAGAAVGGRVLWTRRPIAEPASRPQIPIAATPPKPTPAPPVAPEPEPKPSEPPRVAMVEAHRAQPGHRGPSHRAPPAPGAVLIVPRPYADIFIDGAPVQTGAVQYLAHLPAGAHTIVMQHAGTAPQTVNVDIPAGGRAPDVRVRLQPLPAHLRVQNGQNAGVEVDGKLLGTAGMSLQNPFVLPLPRDAAGQPQYRATVEITLTKPGFKDAQITRTLVAGQTLTWAKELQPQ